MAFWKESTAEPLRQHRWFITFAGAAVDLANLTYALKKVDKPKAKIGEITHKYLNHFFYYPGRLEWEPINLTMASVRQPHADTVLMSILQNAGYGVPSEGPQVGAQTSTIGKSKFKNSLGDISINQVDPDGNKIEEWTLYNPFFTSVQFGTLDYSNEEIVEITCTLRFDYAKLTYNNSNDDGREALNPETAQ
jgi:hypothetical protein